MSSILLAVWKKISRKRKLSIIFLIFFMLISAIAELFSLAAVLPFLQILNNPDYLLGNSDFFSSFRIFSLPPSSSSIILISFIFILASFLSGAAKIINLRLNNKIPALIGSDLSMMAYKKVLQQPYVYHLNSNSSTIIATVTVYVTHTVAGLANFLQLLTSSIIAFFLLSALLYIQWKILLVSSIILGSGYLYIASRAKDLLLDNASVVAELSKKQLSSITDGLDSIRDIIMDGSQDMYVRSFSQFERRQRQLMATNNFLASYPRYAIESLGITTIAAVGASIVLFTPYPNLIPTLGALAIGIQKLLPALQQIYVGWATLKGQRESMIRLLDMLDLDNPNLISNRTGTLHFSKIMELQNISYKYQSSANYSLSNVTLDIRVGDIIGVIGTSGSGKTTLINIIMGLLKPSSGHIYLDGESISSSNGIKGGGSWGSFIAHVPQDIYISDSSIADNIAFGAWAQYKDYKRINDVINIAQLSEFVSNLPHGVDSIVGENGKLLSGGQRQRIAIARALYKGSRLLILDEATSALDTEVEMKIMHEITKQAGDIAIIMIAHRQNTLKNCTKIIELQSGKILRTLLPHELGLV